MKINKLTIFLIIIIFILGGYIVYDKFFQNKDTNLGTNEFSNQINVLDEIKLDYLNIYLTDEGYAYLVPIIPTEIDKLDIGNNFKERLNTLYNRAFYYDIYINNFKLKGFRIKLDQDIIKIRKIETANNIYIVFIKANNTLGILNYKEYYDLLYTNVTDNYNDLKNVIDVKDNKLIYLDGTEANLQIKE